MSANITDHKHVVELNEDTNNKNAKKKNKKKVVTLRSDRVALGRLDGLCRKQRMRRLDILI